MTFAACSVEWNRRMGLCCRTCCGRTPAMTPRCVRGGSGVGGYLVWYYNLVSMLVLISMLMIDVDIDIFILILMLIMIILF